jgi:hypothetical protein
VEGLAFAPAFFVLGGVKMTTLRWARFIRQMTLMELQCKTGAHQVRISSFENGLFMPRPEEKSPMAKALDMPVPGFPSEDGY